MSKVFKVGNTVLESPPVTQQLQSGEEFYTPDIYQDIADCDYCVWSNLECDYALLRANLIHLTPEAATAHAQAILDNQGWFDEH